MQMIGCCAAQQLVRHRDSCTSTCTHAHMHIGLFSRSLAHQGPLVCIELSLTFVQRFSRATGLTGPPVLYTICATDPSSLLVSTSTSSACQQECTTSAVGQRFQCWLVALVRPVTLLCCTVGNTARWSTVHSINGCAPLPLLDCLLETGCCLLACLYQRPSACCGKQ